MNELELENKPSWKSISIEEKNKEKLESILLKLEDYHKKRFRIDKAITHILLVYDKIKDKSQLYKLI